MATKQSGLSLDLIIHPGETLKELLDDRRISQAELARLTGFSQKHISEVVNGNAAVKPELAFALAKAFEGVGANFWLSLQNKYDLELLEHGESIRGMESARPKLKAIDAAMWFLNKHREVQNPDDSEPMTKLKLHKLLYYAQGFFAAERGRKLFGENILAWEHGPVVREVWDEFSKIENREIPNEVVRQISMESVVERTLELVYDKLGQYSAWRLREMTHGELPWKSTPRDHVISWEIIRDYFSENMRKYVA